MNANGLVKEIGPTGGRKRGGEGNSVVGRKTETIAAEKVNNLDNL